MPGAERVSRSDFSDRFDAIETEHGTFELADPGQPERGWTFTERPSDGGYRIDESSGAIVAPVIASVRRLR